MSVNNYIKSKFEENARKNPYMNGQKGPAVKLDGKSSKCSEDLIETLSIIGVLLAIPLGILALWFFIIVAPWLGLFVYFVWWLMSSK